MAGGQAIDLAAVGRSMSAPSSKTMHRRKTGALIEPACCSARSARRISARHEIRCAQALCGARGPRLPDPGRHARRRRRCRDARQGHGRRQRATNPPTRASSAWRTRRRAQELCLAAIAELAALGSDADPCGGLRASWSSAATKVNSRTPWRSPTTIPCSLHRVSRRPAQARRKAAQTARGRAARFPDPDRQHRVAGTSRPDSARSS